MNIFIKEIFLIINYKSLMRKIYYLYKTREPGKRNGIYLYIIKNIYSNKSIPYKF